MGGRTTTRTGTRYGCFLPDLTGLARGPSAANLPPDYIRIPARTGQALVIARYPHARHNQGHATAQFLREPGACRFAERRRDEAFIAARLADATSRLVPVWRSQSLVIEQPGPQAAFLSVAECNGVEGDAIPRRVERLQPFRPRRVASRGAVLPDLLGSRGKFVDLRAVGALIERQEGGMLAYARALIHWHARTRFCSVCGSPAEHRRRHVRKCTNPSCGAEHFPRTDPAVIMLVHDGDRCLLAATCAGRRMTSTLAGFVEPGESLEDAVRARGLRGGRDRGRLRYLLVASRGRSRRASWSARSPKR